MFVVLERITIRTVWRLHAELFYADRLLHERPRLHCHARVRAGASLAGLPVMFFVYLCVKPAGDIFFKTVCPVEDLNNGGRHKRQ